MGGWAVGLGFGTGVGNLGVLNRQLAKGRSLSIWVPDVTQAAVVAKCNYLRVFANYIEFNHCCSPTHFLHSLNCFLPSYSSCVHVSADWAN